MFTPILQQPAIQRRPKELTVSYHRHRYGAIAQNHLLTEESEWAITIAAMKTESSYKRARPGATIFFPIAAGLLTAQLIATCFVYTSNQRVLELARAAESAGYLPLPAGPAMLSLDGWAAAFWGGLFYTLSIGAGATLLTWGILRLCQVLFRWHWPALIYLAVLWSGLLVFVNMRGLVLFPSLFCLLVPAATACACVRTRPLTNDSRHFSWIAPVLTLIALTALWATQRDPEIFVSIRDNILLSNAAGRRVNDFYYRYTLYAAESFKSFNQKNLHSCNLELAGDRLSNRKLEIRLAHHDVLVLQQIKHPDIRVVFAGGKLQLVSAAGRRMEVTAGELWSHPDRVLQSFSDATDRFAPLRHMTLVGLFLGFPVLLFVSVYGMLLLPASLAMGPKRAALTVSGICLVIGVLLFLPMLNAHPMAVTPQNIDAALAADTWPPRVAALRYIARHHLEIADHPGYRSLLASPLLVERYWVARAMAGSRVEETYSQLLSMIRDPQPNVVCQAFYALGAMGRRSAIGPIKQRLVELDHWYAQWYAYGALRKLGWRQNPSN